MRKVALGLLVIASSITGIQPAKSADLDAASAALLQAEAELLGKLGPEGKLAAPQKESPKAALRPEAVTPAARAEQKQPVKSAAVQPAPAKKAAEEAAVRAEAPPAKAEPEAEAVPAKAAKAAPEATQPFKSITKEISGELDNLHGENSALKSQVKSQGKTVQSLQAENDALRKELEQSQAQMKALLAKTSQMRNSLLVAETEVERLNSIVQGINHTAAKRDSYRTRDAYASAPRSNRDILLSPAQEQKATEDMPIATVMVDKANLRAGPGMEHSPIMSIAKGTRLAIETKSGDWYRVVAPTGERAWISRDTVAYGRDEKSSPSRTLHVKSFDPSIEDDAMELVRKGVQEREDH